MSILKNQSGMTLVEVLVSLVLLAVVIIAFSSAFVNGMRSEVWVNNRLEAARLAESIAELIEDNNEFLNDYVDTDLVYSSKDDFIGTSNDALFISLIEEFDQKISSLNEVTIKNYGPVTENLYEIQIIIDWQESSYDLITRVYSG